MHVYMFNVSSHVLIPKHSDVAQKNENKMRINEIKEKILKSADG